MYYSIYDLFTIKACKKVEVRQESLGRLLVETLPLIKSLLDLVYQVLQIYLFSTHYRRRPFVGGV